MLFLYRQGKNEKMRKKEKLRKTAALSFQVNEDDDEDAAEESRLISL